jgi:predicted ATP-dependent serine protease
MATFQNREDEVALICGKAGQGILLNVHGVAGIGKSRLLQEVAQRLRVQSPPALVLLVDFKSMANTPANPVEMTIHALVAQLEDWLSDVSQNVEQVTRRMVEQLIELAARMPVVLMFDATELLKEDEDFWHYIEGKTNFCRLRVGHESVTKKRNLVTLEQE